MNDIYIYISGDSSRTCFGNLQQTASWDLFLPFAMPSAPLSSNHSGWWFGFEGRWTPRYLLVNVFIRPWNKKLDAWVSRLWSFVNFWGCHSQWQWPGIPATTLQNDQHVRFVWWGCPFQWYQQQALACCGMAGFTCLHSACLCVASLFLNNPFKANLLQPGAVRLTSSHSIVLYSTQTVLQLRWSSPLEHSPRPLQVQAQLKLEARFSVFLID